jgi:hypothetical protein
MQSEILLHCSSDKLSCTSFILKEMRPRIIDIKSIRTGNVLYDRMVLTATVIHSVRRTKSSVALNTAPNGWNIAHFTSRYD